MSDAALQIEGLKKQYSGFALKGVSFDVPRGCIVGLIGENGAGKSTILHAVLNLIQKDAGTILFYGQERWIDKDEIGVVFDGNSYPESLNTKELQNVMKCMYPTWNEGTFYELLERFSLPEDKKIKQFSKGMKMKLSIAVAFSHHTKLLILDEATSGLDPIIRDEILDLLLEFIQEEDHAVLMSSHITSDLEKVADRIVFLHEGTVMFDKIKDELLDEFGVIKCSESQFHSVKKEDIVRYQICEYEYQILIKHRRRAEKEYPGFLVTPTSLDEIMLFYVKGEKCI